MNTGSKKQKAFATLIQNAPVNTLSNVLNYIRVFYNFNKDKVLNQKVFLDYHSKYYSMVKEKEHCYFITKDNFIGVKKDFRCEFFDMEYDFAQETMRPKKIVVDIATGHVVTIEDLNSFEVNGFKLKTSYVDPFVLNDHLEQRFPSEHLDKHILIKQKDSTLILVYSIKSFKMKNAG